MLEVIPVPDSLAFHSLEAEAASLIAEAGLRVERFTQNQRPRIDNFVVSDFSLVDASLQWIVDQNLLCGDSFCEWGCGFGVVTMLAALRRMEAAGIEVEGVLVREAEQLAEDLEIEARFAQGSFIPDGGEDMMDWISEVQHVETDSPSGYSELDAEPDDFDLVFAFPCPGEQVFFERLFGRFAADGALLLTYQGIEQMRLQRKIGS